MHLRANGPLKSVLTASLYILLLSLFVSPLQALEVKTRSGNLTMVGVAPYEELRKEYYLAALLMAKPSSDPSEILNSNQHKQMRILVTAAAWAPRLWQKQWLNNIAINNDPVKAGSKLQEDIAFFTRLPESALKAGDALVINYQPGKGTSIALNSRIFIQTKTSALFQNLVKTWIGRLPPSRQFKKQILSMDSNEQAQQWASQIVHHRVPQSRIAEVAAWYAEPEVAKEDVAAKKQAEAKKKAIAKAEKAKQEKEKKEQRKRQLAQEKAKKKAEKEAAKKAKKEQLAREKEQSKKRLARQKAAKAKREKQLKLAKAKKDREQKQEQFYYRDLFEWQLRQAIRQEITYPEWARQFQQEGTVELSFTLDRTGKILESQVQDESVSKMLSNEVLSALEKATKKGKCPRSVTRRELDLYSFTSVLT